MLKEQLPYYVLHVRVLSNLQEALMCEQDGDNSHRVSEPAMRDAQPYHKY